MALLEVAGLSVEIGGRRVVDDVSFEIAEREHSAGVRPGDGRPDDDGVADRTLPPGDVRGHHRLAVAGQHGVRGAEHQRERHGEQADAQRQPAPSDEIVERALDTVDDTREHR